jgi:hypothetical protein
MAGRSWRAGSRRTGLAGETWISPELPCPTLPPFFAVESGAVGAVVGLFLPILPRFAARLHNAVTSPYKAMVLCSDLHESRRGASP